MRSLFRSPAIPPGLSMSECGAAGSASCCTACPFHSTIHHVSGSAELSESCLPQLPVSTPPTGLDECFFFISLVVRLPCGLIFCQFWLFFVFRLLLSLFWLCEEAQCVYLRLHLCSLTIGEWFLLQHDDSGEGRGGVCGVLLQKYLF